MASITPLLSKKIGGNKEKIRKIRKNLKNRGKIEGKKIIWEKYINKIKSGKKQNEKKNGVDIWPHNYTNRYMHMNISSGGKCAQSSLLLDDFKHNFYIQIHDNSTT